MKPAILLLVFCVATAAFSASPATAQAQNASLSLFETLPSDRPPDQITKNSHYWISNEMRLDLFHDSVKDRGGVYIGVGSDQNYLLAGWAKSEVLVLMDFDRKIVDLHRVYNVAFRAATNKAEFLELWEESSSKELQELIKQGYSDKKTQKAALNAHRAARKYISTRFRKVIRLMKKSNLPSFLTDDSQYDYIRGLFLNDKVFMVAGDLTADVTVKAIAKAIEGANMHVGVLYLSNAEQYFSFRSGFSDNMLSLPSNKDSLVVRTNSWRYLSWVEGTEYHYNVQPLDNFKLFLKAKTVRDSGRMLHQATPDAILGVSHLDHPPLTGTELKKVKSKNRISRDVVAERGEIRRLRTEAREQRIAERKAKRAERRAQAAAE
ncbi:MAG: hypothetical protein JKY56_09285 [Kofleriaceae bacterium]|nr:hypothetical protein [Kofleriaceae bacterium]